MERLRFRLGTTFASFGDSSPWHPDTASTNMSEKLIQLEGGQNLIPVARTSSCDRDLLLP